MRKWFKNSLGKRLFIISLLSIVMVLSFSEFLAYRFYVKSQIDAISAGELQKVMSPRVQLDYFLVNYIDFSLKILRDLELRKALLDAQSSDLKTQTNGLSKAHQIIQSDFDSMMNVWGIRLFQYQPDGKYVEKYQNNRYLLDQKLLISDNDSYQVKIDERGEAFLKQITEAKGNLIWSASTQGGLFHDLLFLKEHSSSILLGRFMENRMNPEAQYLLTLEFDPLSMHDIFEVAEKMDNSSLRVVDYVSKRVVFDTQNEQIAKAHDWDLMEPYEWEKKIIAEGVPHNMKKIPFEDMMGKIRLVGDPNHPDELIVYAPVMNAPWVITSKIDLAPMYAKINTQLWNLNLILIVPIILVALLISLYTKRSIARPMTRLADVLSFIGDPFRQPEMISVKGNDELAQLSSATNRVAELVTKNNAITAQVKQLLDNSGQGFLSFDASLIVHSEYSVACYEIFDTFAVAEMNAVELLYPHDQDDMRNVLNSIYHASSPIEREHLLGLLPQEVHYADRVYVVAYKMIYRQGTEAMMVILTDVTKQRQLQTKIEEESKILQMIIKVVQMKADFFYGLDEWNRFVSNGIQTYLLSTDDWKEMYEQFYRTIHTFKGSFGQFGLRKAFVTLHRIESDLSMSYPYWNDAQGFHTHIQMLDLKTILDEELALLQDVLGEQFFTRNTGEVVDMERIRAFENRIIDLLKAEEAELIKLELKKLHAKPFAELLENYPRFVTELAEGLKKQVQPMIIEGDAILVDPDHYRAWTQSLIHVFRNIMDHGIETPMERLAYGKEARGNVTCHVEVTPDTIVLTIADDGRGIDVERVKQKAIEKGLIARDDAETLQVEEIISFIFADTFSTRDEVSELSGRGVGMSAVKAEVESLGGKMDVLTELGYGTKLIMRVPIWRP